MTVSKSYVFERVLEIASRLCWSPADIGLTRVHSVDRRKFGTKADAKKHAVEFGIPEGDIDYAFEWLAPMCKLKGIEREEYLQTVYWPRREQIANILVDAAFQAHPRETSDLIQSLLGVETDTFEFMVCKTRNRIRALTGQPDILFVDRSLENVVLCEIKIGSTQTKYTLDQHLKYLTLARVLQAGAFFPNAAVHIVLFAADPLFPRSAPELKMLDPVVGSDFRVRFDYGNFEAPGRGLGKAADINEVLERRIRRVGLKDTNLRVINAHETVLHYACWQRALNRCGRGGLLDHLSALSPFLLGRV